MNDADAGQAGAVLITGASRGLGAALAEAYARPGAALALAARRQDLLEEVAARCRAKGAAARATALDVADAPAVQRWVASIEAWRPPDLIFANAGAFDGRRTCGAPEPLESALGMVRVNVDGVIILAQAALPGLLARRRGRIVIISSLAALHPLPDAPAYSASKAAAAAYGEALRADLRGAGVGVTIVYPGHIATAQTARHAGPLPLMLSPERAAAIIRLGVARGRERIAFPRRLLSLIRLGRLLPAPWRDAAGSAWRFHVREGD